MLDINYSLIQHLVEMPGNNGLAAGPKKEELQDLLSPPAADEDIYGERMSCLQR